MTDDKLDLEELERLFEKLDQLFQLSEGDWSTFHTDISREWPRLRNAAPRLFERMRALEREALAGQRYQASLELRDRQHIKLVDENATLRARIAEVTKGT